MRTRIAATFSKIGIGVLAGLMLMGGLCRNTPGTSIQVVNGSDAEVRNVEVTYNGGNVGAASIAPKASFGKWVPAKGGCFIKLTFVATNNRQVNPTQTQRSQPCPPTITLTINPDLTVKTDLP